MLRSSYLNKLDYSDIFKTVLFSKQCKTIVEIGILDGYSLETIIHSCPTSQIKAYDIFDEFNGNSRLDWSVIKDAINSLEELRSQKENLSKEDLNKVIEYKAFNEYTINNPLLNGAEVEIKKHFIFNSELEIIRTEE